MDKDSAINYVHQLLHATLDRNASDLFITSLAAPSVKADGEMKALSDQKLSVAQTGFIVRSIMNDKQLKEYEEHLECNFAISLPGKGRFRVNTFTQRGAPGMVLRYIPDYIPNFKELVLPPILKDISMTTRGLVIIVGSTGSGKSTSLASIIDFRNKNSAGHIVTIEDPIEFTHEHHGCLVTQREVGVDTESYEIAMKNTLRQAPDVILLGEVRDRETMEYALSYAETGHLCLTTLHANNASQAIDRIINFFPEEKRDQLLMDLSLNLKGIVSQRLLRKVKDNGRLPAVEVMLNTPLMADLIYQGDIHAIKELISKSNNLGMCTFDQAIFRLIETGLISVKEGLRNADSVNNLRLQLKLESSQAKSSDLFKDTEGLEIEAVDDHIINM